MTTRSKRLIFPILVLVLVTISCGIKRVEKTNPEPPPLVQEEQPAVEAPAQEAAPGISEEGGLINQWAISASASSAFGDPGWSASQASGEPNVAECGDNTSAWASLASDSVEWIELGYKTPVRATLVSIIQSYSPDQVVQVELKDINGAYHTVYSGKPNSISACPYTLAIPVKEDFLVDGVKITVDQTILGTSWNEIDAVELVGMAEGSGNANPENPPSETDFPIPEGAKNVQNIANTTNFQNSFSLDDGMLFYREVFTKTGLTEDKTLTVTSDTTFSMVFRGDPSGKMIVVQGVDLGNGESNISLRKE